MTQAKINKLLQHDNYLSSLAKQCLSEAKSTPRKMLESVQELAAKMFCVRVEDETPLDNIKYDVDNIYKAMLKLGK